MVCQYLLLILRINTGTICNIMHTVGRPITDIPKAFKSLSDETRLRILNLILERECCVCEVMQALEISQSKASRGLSALYDSGFLKMRKNGLWTLYSIKNTTINTSQSLLTQAVKEYMSKNKTAALDKKRLARAKRVGPGCAQRLKQSSSVCEVSCKIETKKNHKKG